MTGLNATISLSSDHAGNTFHYCILRPPPTKFEVNHRKLREIDHVAFAGDVLSLSIASSMSSNMLPTPSECSYSS